MAGKLHEIKWQAAEMKIKLLIIFDLYFNLSAKYKGIFKNTYMFTLQIMIFYPYPATPALAAFPIDSPSN